MSDKLVWSNTMTQDYLSNMPEDQLRAELVDYGYEADMLDTLDYNGLQQLVADDDYMWQNDAIDFDDNIAPEIESQTRDGIILLAGTAGRWDGNHGAGLACWPEDLVGGDICNDCDKIALYDRDGALVWEASHHDGTHSMGVYALPDGEELKNFVMTCMGDAIDDQIDNYDIGAEEAILDVINDLDLEYINNYCDFSKVPEVCPAIKSFRTNESLEEAPIEEAKSKNPENLAMELQSIKDDYEDFGPEGFYAVPFSRFERQYPEFTKSCIMTYLKELEILEPEELNDPEIFEEYWQSGELIIPEDWPILIDGATRLSTDRADKGYTWITLLKKYNKPYDAPDEADESLCEAEGLLDVDAFGSYGNKHPKIGQKFVAELYDDGLGRDRAFCRELTPYGYYQGDVILEDELDQEELDAIGAKEGDKIVLEAVPYDDSEAGYRLAVVGLATDESLKEGLIDELLEDEDVDEIQFPTQDNVLIINEPEVEAVPAIAPETNCVMETATNVMAAYQNANKWLDIVKEFVYANLGCVFFSSYIHNLAHTMPARFDKFGDILHTANMRIPYPETPYIPTEPTDIDSVFANLFSILDCIKANLNDFIKCTDDQQHGMACAAEALLNDIEGEYPTIYKMQQEWANCGGDMAKFDKYVGQFVEHKDDLLA